MNYKLQVLKYELEQRGIFYVFKRLILFFLRPLSNLTNRSEFLVNLFYGVFPTIGHKLSLFQKIPKKLELPQSDLVKEVRKFWYVNIPGELDLDGEKITRKDIFTYGGPNPKFTCSICQKSEWLSRIRQKNLFRPHNCPQSKECQDLCQKQGNDLWTHFHQNFDFMLGCDANLPAPKCLYLVPKQTYQRFFKVVCDQGKLTSKRLWAFTYQIDIIQGPPKDIDWNKYDFYLSKTKG